VGSTVLQTVFIKTGINRSIAFIVTMWSFACLNFLILKYLNTRIVRNAEKEKAAAANNKNKNRGKQRVKAIRGGASALDVHNFVLSVGEPVELHDK
jgi:hypothetical protein